MFSVKRLNIVVCLFIVVFLILGSTGYTQAGILAANSQLIAKSPETSNPAQQIPPDTSTQLDPGEEGAALQAVLALETANRARALADYDAPEENQGSTNEILQVKSSYPRRPTSELTVGDNCTYATIGNAIDAAIPGDTLLLEGGRTFTENISIPITLTLIGGYDGCASGITERTTIDGAGNASVINIAAAISVTLESLNITNGNTGGEGGGIRFALGGGTGQLTLNHIDIYQNTGFWGGGLWAGQKTKVTGSDVQIYNNTSTTYGGGVRLYGSQATFTDNSNIHHNTATKGGGIYGSLENENAPVLTLPSYADIYDNQALTGDGFGGGIYMQEGTISIDNCSDIYNNQGLYGGGLYIITSTLTIHSSCSEIQYNSASNDGGGLYAQSSTVNLDNDAELYNNEAGTGGTGSGGGGYLDNSTLWGDKASISYNIANDYGGGIYATNDSTIDMDLGSYSCLGTRCSRLKSNTATNAYGGGIYAYDSFIDLRNTFIESNHAHIGGGIYIWEVTLIVHNNLFARNSSTIGTGNALRLYTGATLTGNGNTLAYNDTGGTATGEAVSLYNSTMTLACSIIWGHNTSIDASTGTNTVNITTSDIQGGYAGVGNLDINPLFKNAANQDYHLQSTSPVIDQCTSADSPDFDNEIRPIVSTTPSTPYDMGADEASEPHVGINNSGCVYGTLQQAIDAASDGDTLQVAAATYSENILIASKSITIVGSYDTTCATMTGGTTTLDGSYHPSSVVLNANNGTLYLQNLAITGGNRSGMNVEHAQVTLDNTDVYGNNANYGGGLWISTDSTVTLTNDSDIYNNTAAIAGGGARVWGTLIANETYSDIYNNSAPDGGGIAVTGGIVYLNNSDMNQNQATAAEGKGGGVYLTEGGIITLTNNAWIYAGQTAYDGAGIYADHAKVYIVDTSSSIQNNNATNNGGGIYLTNNSELYTSGGNIGYPGSGNEAIKGAGIYALTSTVEFTGKIIDNLASDQGAGIYAAASTINLTGAQVGGTGTGQANQLGVNGHTGAGLYLTDGTRATLNNTTISSNTFQTTGYTYGGGLYVTNGSSVTLTNSTVKQHRANSATDGRGAGIYINNSTVTLDNSQVLSNTARTVGGGLRLYNTSTLHILNGSEIKGNTALNGSGGGIYATNAPTITISNANLENNYAGINGGAMYLQNGILTSTNSSFVANQALANGGAIAADSSALVIDADYTTCDPLTDQCSTFYNNTADNDNTNGSNDYGGAIYLNTGQLQMSHTYLHRNSAWQGGAIYQSGVGSLVDINNTLLYSNTAASAGSGIQMMEGTLTMTQVTLANNTGSDAFSLAGGTANVYNSIAWSNETGGFNGGFATTTCNIDQSGVTGAAVDPQFVAPGAGEDYHLLNTSPAITNCTTGVSPDLDNMNRPAGAGFDMGAYEYPYGVVFTPDNTGKGTIPGIVQYTHWLTNTGSTTDTFTLVTYSSQGWEIAIRPKSPITLTGRAGTPITVSLTIPNDIISGTVDTTLITATSTTAPVVATQVTNTTTVSMPYGVDFAPDNTGNGIPNSSIQYIHWLTNTGEIRDTFTLTTHSSQGWAVNIQPTSPVTLASGLAIPVTVSLTIPAGVVSGTVDTTIVTATSTSNPVITMPITDTTTVLIAYGVDFTPDNTGTGIPNSSVQYTHWLTNTGDITDTFTLVAYSSQGWAINIQPTSHVMLGNGATMPVTVSLTIPAGVVSGTVDTTIVTATSTSNPAITMPVTDTTTVFTTRKFIYLPVVLRSNS